MIMSQTGYYPNVAYILSLIGGIIILLAGLLVAVVGAAVTFMVAGLGGFYGLLGIVWGIIIIYSAMQLRTNPSQHVTWGVIIIVFSFISWIGAFGGFFFGFILALVGGILALIWSPSRPVVTSSVPQTPASSASPVAPATRYCPNCGRSIPLDVKFCPYCGKEVG